MSRYQQALVTAGYAVRCQTSGLDDAMIGISMRNFRFYPETLCVRPGATVTWANLDEEAHIVASLTGLIRSAALDTTQRCAFRFPTPGACRDVCTSYPRLTGTLVAR